MQKNMEAERYTEKQTRILSYLRHALTMGQVYFKSKHIAGDIGLSSQEIGSNMVLLSSLCDDLEITQWGYSGTSTTWKVTSRPDLETIIQESAPAPVEL